jgi:hypothetical protein
VTARDKKLTVAVGALAGFLVLSCIGVPGTEVVWTLAAGWVAYLKRVVPKVTVRWDLVASTAAYLVALVVGAHLLLGWLHRETRNADATAPAPWKWRWTLGATAVVLLMFVCGIAMVGIVHQTVWLARSPEPLYRRGWRSQTVRVVCQSHMREIGRALRLYADENGGSLPDDLRPLVRNETLDPFHLICPGSDDDESAPGATPQERADHLLDGGHCSYVYLGKGLSFGDGRAVLVEPLENHEGIGLNVLYGNERVEWLDRPAATKLLLSLGFERVEAARK